MADREVTATAKDEDSDITALCNDAESWSPRQKADAIADTSSGDHAYYVEGSAGRVDIRVVTEGSVQYLRTDPSSITGDNLDDLPDC